MHAFRNGGRGRWMGLALMTVLALGSRASLAQAASGQKPVAWPDALVLHSGEKVASGADFLKRRRPELLSDFAENEYGRTPQEKIPVVMTVTSMDAHALDGLAVRKQITMRVGSGEKHRDVHLLLYLPAHAVGKVPVFVGLNFNGNQSVNPDPGIDLNDVWEQEKTKADAAEPKHVRRRALEQSRGSDALGWPVEMILKAGFGVATIYAGDLEPDFIGGTPDGIRTLFHATGAGDDWGAIGAWAWGMSRALDYLVTDPSVDADAVIAIGHSRMGKAALWAAAQDERFAAVISNESGQGGAGLQHREAAETIEHLNTAFPYWFCENYHRFTGHAGQLPVDGHLLLALIAPRPLFVASAEGDKYSDPRGEFLATAAASEVYQLFGAERISADADVKPGRPVGSTIRYYMRAGGHAILAEDWSQYLAFAKAQMAARR